MVNAGSTGYYWTSTLYPFVSSAYIGLTSPGSGYLDRYIGIPIRPVYGEANTNTDYDTPEMVDLGLSVKWASFNLGATDPEEFGDYFAWGDTEPYYEPGYAQSLSPIWRPGKEAGYACSDYKWSVYYEDWESHWDELLTKYSPAPSFGYNGFTDRKTVLDPEDDPAHVHLGGKWRTPTKEEAMELLECKWEGPYWYDSDEYHDVDGWKITGPNGNSIFLPAAGTRIETDFFEPIFADYWTSSLDETDPLYAHELSCDYYVTRKLLLVNGHRGCGFSIRPVYDDK
jgi:hypothetical protein